MASIRTVAPEAETVLARAEWWAEIFETPCVAVAAAPDEIGPLAATGAEFVGLESGLWLNEPDAVAGRRPCSRGRPREPSRPAFRGAPGRGAAGAGARRPGPLDPAKTAAPSDKKTTPELPSPYTPNYSRGAVPPNSGQPADLAYGAYQRGQYVTAFREATKRIEANPKDAAAMTLLGELYNQGLGVKQNPVKAAEWYRLAPPRTTLPRCRRSA